MGANEKKPSIRSKAIRIVMAFSLAISTVMAPSSALAAESVHVSIGDDAPYAGYTTTWMYADGEVAYCADPASATPNPGTYSKTELTEKDVIACLWFSYGSPGFDKSLFPKTWYDGSGWTGEKYLCASHVLLSYAYQDSKGDAVYGTNGAFEDWAREHLLTTTYQAMKDRKSEVPPNFYPFIIHTGAGTQVLVSFKYIPYGAIELTKVSAVADTSDDNDMYSVKGAVYGVYSNASCTKELGKMTTDKNGYAKLEELMPGDVYVKELKASKGMALDETVYKTEVIAGETTTVNKKTVKESPQTNPLHIFAKKFDTDTGKGDAQGDATLAGAVFDVAYYDNVKGEISGTAERSWKFKTDANGEIWLNDGAGTYFVSGDELYKTTDRRITFPIGTYRIQETEAPEGYLVNNAVHVMTVKDTDGDTGTSEAIDSYVAVESYKQDDADGKPVTEDDVIRGGVMVTKADAEIEKSEAIGGEDHSSTVGANLNGIEFTITNQSKLKVKVNDTWYEPRQVIGTIETSWNDEVRAYTAQTAADLLPYGTYSIQETKTNDSYLLTDGEPKTFQIREDGMVVCATVEDDELVFYDQVVRNDLEITKKADDTNRSLQVPFSIRNVITGETHVIVTDRNGDVSTASSWNLHSNNTNGNDGLLDMGSITADDMDPRAGVWFGLAEDGTMAPVNDALAALPYGEYELAELRCDANDGYDLITKKFWIERDSGIARAVWMALDDQPSPDIQTEATDKADGDHFVQADQQVTLVDTVYYENLKVGNEYTVTGTLMVKSTGEALADADGNTITATKTFKARSASGTVDLEFTFDASLLAGEDIVAFESVTKDGIKVAAHADIDDEGQTVRIVKIGTQASDSFDGDEYVTGGEVTVVDTVSYEGLTPGTEYALVGTLMDAQTGSPVQNGDADATASITFTPEETSGTANVEFTFDVSDLGGHSLVVFEKLFMGDAQIAAHEDIDDDGQTVIVVEIGTTAADKADGDHYVEPGEVTVTDTVTYKGLKPGTEYNVTGALMVKSTGEALADADGNPITATTSFTPKESEGEVVLEFAFDASLLEGDTVVAFESVSHDSIEVAAHADINNEPQSIHVVKIGTTLTDAADGDHVIDNGKVTLIDTVEYKGLIPSANYQMVGTLMDKSTGETLIGSNGKAVMAEATFTAENADGTVEVTFEFDASALTDGAQLVAFEKLLDVDANLVTSHEDIDDEGQTVKVQVPDEPENPGTPEKPSSPETPGTPKTGSYGKTGASVMTIILAIGIAGTAAVGGFAYSRRKHHIAQLQEMEDEVLGG